MAELRGLFLNDESAEKHSFSFIAGFHVGFPLAVLQTKGAAGWLEIRDLLFKTFSESSKKFHVISSDYDPETIFPLGKPLIIQYDNFIEDICFISDLEALGVPVKSDKYKLDHLIWICSSGIVLLMWKISTNDERLYRKLRSTIYDNDQYDPSKHYYTSQRYVDLANIFIQISQIVRNAVSTPNLAFLFETSKHVDEFQRACLLLDNLAGFNVDETVQIKHLSNAIKKEKNNRILFEELLIDVYYIEVNQCATDNDFQIGYIESILNTKDPQYILTTAAIYSSFVGFLWLRRYLAEELESLQQILASEKTMRGEFLSRMRLFRIFCTQLINESAPISIRLMHIYMSRIEQFWKESRMYELVNQIQGQLETLESMLNSVEELNKEIRNFKVGIAAVLLSLISITAVIAQLISTLDIFTQLGLKDRVVLIMLGFAGGILSTVVIYAAPSSWRLKRR